MIYNTCIGIYLHRFHNIYNIRFSLTNILYFFFHSHTPTHTHIQARYRTLQRTNKLAANELKRHSQIHSTKSLTAILCSVAEVTRVGIGVAKDLEGIGRNIGVPVLRDMVASAKKQLSDVQAMYREAKIQSERKRLKTRQHGKHGGGQAMYMYPPLGMDKDIPPYLKTLTPVMRKNIGKQKLEGLIELVWGERVQMRLRENLREKGMFTEEQMKLLPERHWYAYHGRDQKLPEEVLPENSTLADFLAYHLEGEYGKENMAEWGYNILAACEKHVYDADIELFYLCLMGAVSEFVYDDSVKLMTSFSELVTNIDIQNSKYQHFVGATVSNSLVVISCNIYSMFLVPFSNHICI